MADGIGYAPTSWNPIAMRCTQVSPGCLNCWHLRMCERHAANDHFSGAERAAYAGGKPVMRDHILCQPLHWRNPRRVAVQFMGDPFHPKVPYEFLSRMFATMAIAERHTFLVLTKRPDYLAQLIEAVRIGTPWPLPNVLLGVTVEDQRRADERMPHLMILAAMGWRTWVSCEPALGAVDWERWLMRNDSADDGRAFPSGRVSWLVCGGETGPGARPMRIEWASTAAKQCRDAGVPFFFKGWGDWFPDEQLVEERRQRPGSIMLPWPVSNRQIYHFDGGVYYRVGKKLAGRLLDGVEHNELPGKD